MRMLSTVLPPKRIPNFIGDNALGLQKRVSKAKKNIRKNTWKKKVEKQVVRALFLSKYLVGKRPVTEMPVQAEMESPKPDVNE